MQSAWIDFLARGVPTKELDQVRYDVYLAASEVFNGESNTPSPTDRELVSAAFYAKSRFADFFDLEQPTGVAVLSPDDHVIKIISFLTNQNENGRDEYGGVKAYSTRDI